jgi:L-2-hydroxyglutarate oxidase LhgO
MQSDFDIAIIGAGVIGLSIAAKIPKKFSVIIIEKNRTYGLESSTHNSEVIHAGIYYKIDSLKHKLCLNGNAMIYDWCEKYDVHYNKIGKLVVSLHDNESETFENAWELASKSGANVRRISKNELRKLEPSVNIAAGFLSSNTGIIDSVGFLKSLEFVAKNNGVNFGFNNNLQELNRNSKFFKLGVIDDDGSATEFTADIVINAAGHGSPNITRMLGYPLDGSNNNFPVFEQRINKGVYFDIINSKINNAVHHLIYPVPKNQKLMQNYIDKVGGLGIHLTKTLDGIIRLGPDTEWIKQRSSFSFDYQNSDNKLMNFFNAGKEFFPDLKIDDLVPSHVGYRTKINVLNEEYSDFLIWVHNGYVHLGGIESPGLTASLAIADKTLKLLNVS